MYNVTVSHGAKKHQLTFDETPSSEDLSAKIEDVTGVPYSRQKLIHKGKFYASCIPLKMRGLENTGLQELLMNSIDALKISGKQISVGKSKLCELGITPGSKIMLLGRQHNPQNDEIIQKINKVYIRLC